MLLAQCPARGNNRGRNESKTAVTHFTICASPTGFEPCSKREIARVLGPLGRWGVTSSDPARDFERGKPTALEGLLLYPLTYGAV